MSTTLAVAVLACWLLAASVFTRRWKGVVPPLVADLPDAERWGATQSFLSLQADRNVNRWRRTIVASGAVLIVLAWGIVEDERRDTQRERDRQEQDEQAEEQDCRTRIRSRADVRSAIAAGVDEVAAYAELNEVERAIVVERTARRVYTELPPPDC